MIKSLSLRPYLSLIVFLLGVLSFPKEGSEAVRNFMISGIAPTWQGIDRLRAIFATKVSIPPTEEINTLQEDNQILRHQLTRMQEWLTEMESIKKQMGEYLEYSGKEDPFFQRRAEYLKKNIENQLHAVPAKVIFREPSLWNSSLWINVGKRDNQKLGREIIAKNSPVVLGKNIVGVVEVVKEKTSRIRLITDPMLTPSVRVVRGKEQNRVLFEKLVSVLEILNQRDDLERAEEFSQALVAFVKSWNLEERDLYLAKGELHGSGDSLWRVYGPKLKGVGFNYDFADEEGFEHNLRTGAYVEGRQEPLIRTGDLLVTTGMDRIFPPDLHVGFVSKILPLREGGCSYGLEAKTLLDNFNTLSEVFVLPPQ